MMPGAWTASGHLSADVVSSDSGAASPPVTAVRDVVSLLADLCVPQVPRALALMDRDPSSRTYGSMDRPYWYYRTLTNFPGATWQQPMVGLAALGRARHATNPFANDATVLEAARAALLAWTRSQHRNGAFDEWYRNEYSYCPTAITSAGAVVALDLLGDAIDTRSRVDVLEAVRRAGRWLAPRYNTGVMNQNLAAAVTFAGLARLDDDPQWHAHAAALLQRIAVDQSAEGWFPEYGGFDFGYSTLALDCLALASRFGLSEMADPMAGRLAQFLLNVLTDDCAIPGRIGSRGTGHAFPFGAMELSTRLPHVRALVDVLLRLHVSGMVAGPACVDDRYFAYFYFPGFCLAYHAAASRPEWPEPVHLPPAIHSVYPESGLVLWRQPQATLVLNRRRGGAAAVLRRGEQALYHLGYTVVWRGTRYSSAGWRHDETDSGVDAAFDTAQFSKVSGGLPLRWLTIPFQLVVHALVSGRLAELFQSLVKRTMISPTGTIPLTMQRRVTVDSTGIHVEDALRPARPLSITSIAVTGQATMHSPSARQDGGDVVGMPPPAQAAVQAALRDGQPVTLHWNIVPGRGRSEVRVGS